MTFNAFDIINVRFTASLQNLSRNPRTEECEMSFETAIFASLDRKASGRNQPDSL